MPLGDATMQLSRFMFFAALTVIGELPLVAQTAGARGVPAPQGADPKDVGSVDAIISALYDANSLLLSPRRDEARFRSLFVAGARMMPAVGMADGSASLGIRSVDEYIRRVPT